MNRPVSHSKYHKCIAYLLLVFVLCVPISFHFFYYSTNIRFFFLNMPAKLLNSELFCGRNYTYFSLILPQYICWLYNCTILEMNIHSVHVISKVVPSLPPPPSKVSAGELLKMPEVRWLGALRIPVLYPVIPSQPIWWLLWVSPLRTTGKPEGFSFFPYVGMAGENTPFQYIQVPGDPQRYPHSRTCKCLFFSFLQ